MNRKILSIVLITLAAIIGGSSYLLVSSNSNKQQKQDAAVTNSVKPATKQNSANSEASATSTTAGVYTDYNENYLSTTTGTRLLFFHAPWCPQCRALDKDIKEKGVPSDVAIVKVDYDSNQLLRQKYGVTIQTTFVKVDGNGQLVEKYVAYDEPTLDSVIKNLL